jgi:hypothetical protein
VQETCPDVPAVPAVLFAVRFSVTWSPATLTVMPDAWSVADFDAEPEPPPHAATPTARRDNTEAHTSARERREIIDHTIGGVPKGDLRASEEFGISRTPDPLAPCRRF